MNRSTSYFLILVLLMGCGWGLAAPAQAEEYAYIGSNKCKKCHIKEYKSWAETKMANSFELLKPGVRAEQKTGAGLDPEKDYTQDTTCLPCHVVGYGKTGGFVDAETTPGHLGTGCEMCHGPGGTYIQDQYMSLKNKEYKKAEVVAVGMVDTVSMEQCAVCHNEESPFVGEGYVFDFEARKDEGAHENFPLKYQH